VRRWGVIISGFYAAVVVGFLMPVSLVIYRLPLRQGQGFEWWNVYTTDGEGWIAIVMFGLILVGGQALLLFLSVDTSWRRLKPRRHVAVSAALTGFFIGLLATSAVLSLTLALPGDGVFDGKWLGMPVLNWILMLWPALWFVWGIVFYRYCRGGSMTLERVVSWMLKGSVLELLIAVPAHVIVRSRGDCSAPVLTSWGIVTGVAVMLMCFGPGVLALYKKRIDAYGTGKVEDPSV
jgi:hypothetical protein